MTDIENARKAINNVLGGNPPNGITPEMCGPWAEVVTAVFNAHGVGGQAEAVRVFKVMQQADRDLARLMSGADGDAATPLRLLHADDLGKLPPTRWLIDNVLPTNKLAMLFGPPGIGKSFLNLDIALSVAQFANVVYIAAEDAEDFHSRTHAWCEQHNLKSGGLYFWTEPLNLFDEAALDAFISAISPLRPALIVIDPLANCMVGKEENSTGDMNLATSGLNRIRRATQASILLCHHTGWSDAHERGSSVLRGACRIVMRFASQDERLVLTCEKINGAKKFEPRRFRLVERGDSVVMLPESETTTRGAALTSQQRAVLEALNLTWFEDGATQAELIDHTSIAKASMNYTVNALVERQYVQRSGQRNRTVSITELGRKVLASQGGAQNTAQSIVLDGDTELLLNWRINRPGYGSGEVQSPEGY